MFSLDYFLCFEYILYLFIYYRDLYFNNLRIVNDLMESSVINVNVQDIERLERFNGINLKY